jgi:hypothetical protein
MYLVTKPTDDDQQIETCRDDSKYQVNAVTPSIALPSSHIALEAGINNLTLQDTHPSGFLACLTTFHNVLTSWPVLVKLLLALASTVILDSEPSGTHDGIQFTNVQSLNH